MADIGSMKAPELRELLVERGVKVNLTRVKLAVLKKMAEEGLMDLPETMPVVKVDLKLAIDDIKKMSRTQKIEKIKEVRPAMTGLTRKSANELETLLKEITTYGNAPLFGYEGPPKANRDYWVEEAKKLGFKGMVLRKKREELEEMVLLRRKINEEKEIAKLEAEEKEDAEVREAPLTKPDLQLSLESFNFISGHPDLFLKILIVMQLFEILIKRSPYGKQFTLDLADRKIKVDVKTVKKSLQYYFAEMKKTFAKATKDWKIKQPEKSELRREVDKVMKTDKQIYDGIQNILVNGTFLQVADGMGMTFDDEEDAYYLRIDEDLEDTPDKDGRYEYGAGFMGIWTPFEEAIEELEDYNEEKPDKRPAFEIPKPPPLDPDRIKPLELEEGQDWKSLTLPNKVKYFLSLVPYNADTMGQIERQSQAKIDRMIERARYDEGEDEEMPSHYFREWLGGDWGANIFDEYNVVDGNMVPDSIEGVPNKKGRFFKGVFFDDDVEYIVNYYGMYGVKDVIESEILKNDKKNRTVFDWKHLSWVKYKRFNFWRRPIVLEMTKGPMMIVPVYNIYDIRQSTIGVRPIDGVFEFSWGDGMRREEPDDFVSIQEQLVKGRINYATGRDDDFQAEDSSEEEESEWVRRRAALPDRDFSNRPIFRRTPFQDLKSLPPKAVGRIMAFSGVPQQEMLPPPVDELEERMESLSVSSLPPNEQELLPDATPPVEKEKVAEAVSTPPEYYDRMGVKYPSGILPPDPDAEVEPMVSGFSDDGARATEEGDWGTDILFYDVVMDDEYAPDESGIWWVFAEILKHGGTEFIGACQNDSISRFQANYAEIGKPGTMDDEVFDINTGKEIGIVVERNGDDIYFHANSDFNAKKPDEDAEEDEIEGLRKKAKTHKMKLKIDRGGDGKGGDMYYFKDRDGVVYDTDSLEALGTINNDRSIHFY